jgi:Cu/Ag efflux protein CusF
MIRLPLWLLGVLALILLMGLSTPILAEDNPPGQAKQAMETTRGQITKVLADQHQFTLKDQKGREWTFQVGRENKIRFNDKDTELASLKTGDQITVHYRLQARDIRTDEANRATELTQGQITKLLADQNQFVLKDREGKEWTFHVNRDAKVRLNDKTTNFADLKTGDNVTILYEKQNDQFMARDIRSGRGQQAPGVAKGQVTMISGENRQLTLKDRDGKEKTFQVGQNAKVRVNGEDSKFADLKKGNEVTITYGLVARDIRSEPRNP